MQTTNPAMHCVRNGQRKGLSIRSPDKMDATQTTRLRRCSGARNAKAPAVSRRGLWNTIRSNLLRGFGFDARPVDQFDVGHRRVVAVTRAALEDAQVAALALAIARAELDEELADGNLVAQAR